MDVVKIACLLGASLPIVVVGATVALSETVDPPPEEVSPEEERRLARALCTEGARMLVKYGHDIGDMATAVLENRMSHKEVVDKLERMASSLEREILELWRKAEGAEEATQRVVGAVRSFSKMPPEYIRTVVKYMSLGELSTEAVQALLKSLSIGMIDVALDSYCTCLRRAGVICTS